MCVCTYMCVCARMCVLCACVHVSVYVACVHVSVYVCVRCRLISPGPLALPSSLQQSVCRLIITYSPSPFSVCRSLMATAPSLSENEIQYEQNNPVPAYSTCTAKKDFKGTYVKLM